MYYDKLKLDSQSNTHTQQTAVLTLASMGSLLLIATVLSKFF